MNSTRKLARVERVLHGSPSVATVWWRWAFPYNPLQPRAGVKRFTTAGGLGIGSGDIWQCNSPRSMFYRFMMGQLKAGGHSKLRTDETKTRHASLTRRSHPNKPPSKVWADTTRPYCASLKLKWSCYPMWLNCWRLRKWPHSLWVIHGNTTNNKPRGQTTCQRQSDWMVLYDLEHHVTYRNQPPLSTPAQRTHRPLP